MEKSTRSTTGIETIFLQNKKNQKVLKTIHEVNFNGTKLDINVACPNPCLTNHNYKQPPPKTPPRKKEEMSMCISVF
jgi:hypothetical protein